MGTTTEISDKPKGGKLFLCVSVCVCVCARVWVCLVALNVFSSFLSSYGAVSLSPDTRRAV